MRIEKKVNMIFDVLRLQYELAALDKTRYTRREEAMNAHAATYRSCCNFPVGSVPVKLSETLINARSALEKIDREQAEYTQAINRILGINEGKDNAKRK